LQYSYLLPPFQIIVHFIFVLSQTSLIFTMFIEKTNIYNIKLVLLTMKYVLIVHLFGIVDFFYKLS
jgi:hypothetical protein